MGETNMPIGKRFWKVLSSPREAFAAVAEDPRFLWPGLIIIAIAIILSYITIPETQEYTRQYLTSMGLNSEQVALNMKSFVPRLIILTMVAMPVVWLIQAALLMLYNQFSVGEARFKQLFSVAVFSGLPSVIKGVLSTVLIKTMGYKTALAVNTSLALFMGTASPNSFLYRFMGKIELFSIWGLVLLIIGGSLAMKKNARGLALFMGIIWLLYIVAMAALVKTPAV